MGTEITAPPMTKEERERKWWSDRNDRKRERYANDPEFREQALIKGREIYRNTKAGTVKEFSAMTSLSDIRSVGALREIYTDSVRVTAYALTSEELAEALGGYNPNIMYRWYTDGRLPRPIFTAMIRTPHGRSTSGEIDHPVMVFSAEEALAIAVPLAKHQIDCAYFRSTHVDVIDAIANGVEQARRKLGA